MRIATHSGRSYLNNPNSMEISHALFEEGTLSRLRSLYATHPPLEKRIRAILPDWDGEYDMERQEREEQAAAAEVSRAGVDDSQRRREALLTGMTGVLVAEAMLQLNNEAVDILVSDLKLAGEDCAPLLKGLAQAHPRLLSLVITPFRDTQALLKLINEAQSAYNRAVPRAEGDAQRTIQEAEGYALDRVNRARGDATRFTALYDAYRQAPEVTRARMYLETLNEVLPKSGRKVIIGGDLDGVRPLLTLEGVVPLAGAARAAAPGGGSN